jgi:hypothetical protein
MKLGFIQRKPQRSNEIAIRMAAIAASTPLFHTCRHIFSHGLNKSIINILVQKQNQNQFHLECFYFQPITASVTFFQMFFYNRRQYFRNIQRTMFSFDAPQSMELLRHQCTSSVISNSHSETTIPNSRRFFAFGIVVIIKQINFYLP